MQAEKWPSRVRPAYAGIGSRETPSEVIELMERIARALAARGWVLHTGMAEGADQAFYRGAAGVGPVELYLPWPAFERQARVHGTRECVLAQPARAAHDVAARFHPVWSRLGSGPRRLHARNCHQVLGADLATPARMVVCWTPDGSLDGRGRRVGGTGQALRVASHSGIEVVNLARREHEERVCAKLAVWEHSRDAAVLTRGR
ncbi:MAG TPA: hypothetical protein VID29_03755 [Solirubrobacteraceae bacterium]|jgi:hypothetical protein